MKNIFNVVIYLGLIAFACGCARSPEQPVASGRQIVLTMRVAGRISPLDSLDPGVRRYYFIAIDNDADQNTGPWAVVAPPFGGNGWVTSADAVHSVGLTSYFVISPEDQGGSVFGVLAGSYFLNTTAPRPPVRLEILDSGATIRVTLDMNQIATGSIGAESINQLNINFITTNQLAVNPSYSYPERQWDSLGAGGQDYINVDTSQSRVWSEDDERGDVNDPDLDIVHWSVEVRNNNSRL